MHAAPVMTHGLEDLQTVKGKAQKELEAEMQRLKCMEGLLIKGAGEAKDRIQMKQAEIDPRSGTMGQARKARSKMEEITKGL